MSRVTIINGDPTLRMLWRDLFIERGYDAAVAPPDLAQQPLMENEPDLVVLDVDSLPSVGQGLHLIEHIRALLPNTPIIAISEWSVSSLREEAHDLGASVCVRKPLNYVVFLKLVDAMMSRMEVASQAG
jgi:DNA-binding response OmpR family regulator